MNSSRKVGKFSLVLLTLSAQVSFSQDDVDVIDRVYDKENRVIRLDPNDKTIDVWSTPRDLSKDKREAGPINVQRYSAGVAHTGIPTFFKLPIALTPEDLIAGKVDVAIVGNAVASGGGRPGAAMAANFVRMGEPLSAWGAVDQTIPEIMVNPFSELTIVDYGDVGVDPFSVETSAVHLADVVEEVARTGAIPIMVGGDHASLYPNIVGVGRVHGKGNFTLIHVDAHADNGGSTFGHFIHIASVNRLSVSEGWVKGENFIQAGMRSPYVYNRDYVNWFPANKAHLFMMAEFRNRGFREVGLDIAKVVKNGPGKVYISVDIDVLEPGLAPAVTGPELGGFTTRELIELIRTIAVSAEVIGMDFVEYNPMLDDAPGTTRMVVSRLLRESLGAIALQKGGITEPFYYAPETDYKTREKLFKSE